MNQLARILLDVDARYTDAAHVAVHQDIQIAVLAQRHIELTDLIRLGQIGIKVVFPVVLADAVDGAIQRVPHFDCVIDDLLVQHGQRAGQTHAHGTAQRVDLRAKGIFTAAKNFGFGTQLRMDLKADNHFIILIHHLTAPLPQNRRRPSRNA